MTDAPALSVVRDYPGLMEALRKRAESLRLSREAIDTIAGVSAGFTAHVLAPVPIKAIGPLSLGPILSAMGLKLIVAEDEEMMARIAGQLAKHHAKRKDAGSTMLAQRKRKPRRFSAFGLSQDFAKITRAAQIANQTPAARRALARKAANARWKQRRAKRKARAECVARDGDMSNLG